MGVRNLTGTYDGSQIGATVWVDSTTNLAFGPLFDHADQADEFHDWLEADPRGFTDAELALKFAAFREPREPSDDELTRRGPYLMDGRHENDPSL